MADHDDRTARVVDALAEEVLTEATLLALERVRQRLERAIVGSTEHTATTAVVKQSVHRFLKHALFVAHDDFRRVQIHQLLQPVVAVDDAAIEIVQIRGREASAVQRHQGAQLRGDNRQHIQNHPLRLVRTLAESLDNLEPFGVLDLFLRGGLSLHPLAQFDAQLVNLNTLEQFLDGLSAHHGLEAGWTILLVELAITSFVLDDLALFYGRVAWIDNNVGLEVENAL